jgi:GAF domain-containing protein
MHPRETEKNMGIISQRGVGRIGGYTDILVVHVAQQLDLAERTLGVDLVVEGVGDLLDRHLLPRLRVERRAATHTQRRTNQRDTRRDGRERRLNRRSERGSRPDDAVGALADGEDGGLVLGGDLEHVAENIVLDESAAVAQRRLDVLHHACAPRRLLLRWRRLLTSCRTAGAGFCHLLVRRQRPAVHGRIWIARRKGRESGGGYWGIRCCEIWSLSVGPLF